MDEARAFYVYVVFSRNQNIGLIEGIVSIISELVRRLIVPAFPAAPRIPISVRRASPTCGFTTVSISLLFASDAEPCNPQKVAGLPSRS